MEVIFVFITVLGILLIIDALAGRPRRVVREKPTLNTRGPDDRWTS